MCNRIHVNINRNTKVVSKNWNMTIIGVTYHPWKLKSLNRRLSLKKALFKIIHKF